MKPAIILIALSLIAGVLLEFQNPFVLDERSSSQFTEQADILMRQNKFQKAAIYLRRALELDPNDEQALEKCVYIYRFVMHDQRKVVDLCSSIINKSPKNVSAYAHRMIAHFEGNERAKAINDMKVLTIELPNDAYAHIIMALGYNWLGENKISAKCVSKAIEIEPNNSEYYIVRGSYFINCRNYQEAAKDYAKAMKLNPNCADDYGLRFSHLRYALSKEGFIKPIQKVLGLSLRMQQKTEHYAKLAL